MHSLNSNGEVGDLISDVFELKEQHACICPVRTAFADAYWQRMPSEEKSFGQASISISCR